MSMAPATRALRCFAHLLLIFPALIYGARPAFAQTTGSFGELTQQAEPSSRIFRSSEEAQENQQQPHAQAAVIDTGFIVRTVFHDKRSETSQFAPGLKTRP